MRILWIILPILAVGAVVFLIYSHRTAFRPGTRALVLDLPTGWYEVPGESPRAFRSGNPDSGILQISLLPPPDREIPGNAGVEEQLERLLDGLDMELGERLSLTSEKARSGIVATALYKRPKHGLVQYWLIPGEVTIFATYTMGNPGNATAEFAQAAKIMKTAGFQ